MNYLSQTTHKEQIEQNILNEIIDNTINNFIKYKSYFEYTDVIDENYKKKY